MDFSFSADDLAFADEARSWLEANVPTAWRKDHCWTRVELISGSTTPYAPNPGNCASTGGVGGSGLKAAANMLRGRVPEHFHQLGFVGFAADYRRFHFGEDEIQDVLAAYRMLAGYPFVDKNRIAGIGGSHGGYLAQMLATRVTPAATVSFAGLTDIGTLAALELDGKVRWQTNLVERFGPDTLYWDHGTSPVLTARDVVMARMHNGESWVAAFDKATGKTIWVSSPQARHYDTNYSTPIVATVNGQRLMMVGGTDGVFHALQVNTGKPVWNWPGNCIRTWSSPTRPTRKPHTPGTAGRTAGRG